MNLGNRYNQASFTQNPTVNMPRSTFNRSHAVKDTFDFDWLTPLYVEEVLPGDTIRLNVKSFIRLATQVVPVLDTMYVDYFFFFCPTRLVWDNFQKFMGEQDNPGDSTDFIVPTIANIAGNIPYGGLLDHFGLPAGRPFPNNKINVLPLRAYNRIWNEWFRDQDINASIPVPKNNGPDDPANYVLRKRAKKPDYFTTGRPLPQKGPALLVPFNKPANLPIATNGNVIKWKGSGVTEHELHNNGTAPTAANIYATPGGLANGLRFGSETGLVGITTGISGGTINELRQAIQLQSMLELDSRSGTRYIEVVKAHWNVTNPDFRLQRTEFLSSGTTIINQHPVVQTSETATTPQANLAAFSTAASNGQIGFSKSFTEHGYVIGLIQARGEVTYQQGLNRMWTRSTKYDFFWPKLQDIGEQPIYMQELYMQSNNQDNLVFAYQERNAEYKYRPSEVRGQFRSSYPQALDVWHLAQQFSSLPTLSPGFIASDTPIERSLVLTEDAPHLLADYWFDQIHSRVMHTHSIPAHIGRL